MGHKYVHVKQQYQLVPSVWSERKLGCVLLGHLNVGHVAVRNSAVEVDYSTLANEHLILSFYGRTINSTFENQL